MGETGTSAIVALLCPNLKCRKLLRVPEKCRGQHVRCQFCGLTFRVPDAKPPGKPGERTNQSPH